MMMGLITALLLVGLTHFPSALQSSSPYSIVGQVYYPSGKNASDVRVCATITSDQRNTAGCALTDHKGRFILPLTKPGTYRVVADKEKDGYVPETLIFFRHPHTSIPEVEFDEFNRHGSVSITLSPKNAIVTGLAVDATTNLPVDNMKFVLCHADQPKVCFTTSAKSADGKFRVYAPHVPFTLKVTADGYEDSFGTQGVHREELIHVAAGANLKLTIRLARRPDAIGKTLSEAEKRVGINLAAPAQVYPEDNARFDHFPRKTTLSWAPVEGAAFYAVEVDYCRGFGGDPKGCDTPQPYNLKENPPTSRILGTSYTFVFLGAQPGRWRVWSVDEAGQEGFKSPWRTFSYLR